MIWLLSIWKKGLGVARKTSEFDNFFMNEAEYYKQSVTQYNKELEEAISPHMHEISGLILPYITIQKYEIEVQTKVISGNFLMPDESELRIYLKKEIRDFELDEEWPISDFVFQKVARILITRDPEYKMIATMSLEEDFIKVIENLPKLNDCCIIKDVCADTDIVILGEDSRE